MLHGGSKDSAAYRRITSLITTQEGYPGVPSGGREKVTVYLPRSALSWSAPKSPVDISCENLESLPPRNPGRVCVLQNGGPQRKEPECGLIDNLMSALHSLVEAGVS